MICELDENDFCARHKERHVGGVKDLALDPGPKGQRYRDHWDVLAGLLSQEEWDRKWMAVPVQVNNSVHLTKSCETCKHFGRFVRDEAGQRKAKKCGTCPGSPVLPLHLCGAGHGEVLRTEGRDCPDWQTKNPSLVINHGAGGLGDALLGLCCVAGLKHSRPELHVTYKAHAQVLPFLSLFDGYDDLAVHTHEYDLARSAIPGDVQMNAGYQSEFEERRATRRWERYCQNIGSPGAVLPNIRDRERLLELGNPWAGVVILAPFSTWTNREWHINAWLTLERNLLAAGQRPVVIDSQHDRVGMFSCERILGASAEQVAGMMLNAKCVVSNDSGPAHLGGILGMRTIVLCGQTTGPSIYGPYPNMRFLEGELVCSGCWWRGMYRDDRCSQVCAALASITPNRVLEEILHAGS